MTREVVPGIYRIQECGPDRGGVDGREVHVPQHAYLLCASESLLFDTLSPAATDTVLSALDDVLEDGLDYLAPSHPDVPHAGNTAAILDAYPDADLLGPRYGSGHELYHLDEATLVGAGDSLDLGGLRVTFHEAPFPDAAVHMWMREATTDTLFTVDWCGFPHLGDECDLFVDEFEREVTVDRLVTLNEFVLFWLEYVDVERTHATIDRIAETFEPAVVAPGHGNPIRAAPIDHLEKMKRATERIAAAGDGARADRGGGD